jgi:hypothetical protein
MVNAWVALYIKIRTVRHEKRTRECGSASGHQASIPERAKKDEKRIYVEGKDRRDQNMEEKGISQATQASSVVKEVLP